MTHSSSIESPKFVRPRSEVTPVKKQDELRQLYSLQRAAIEQQIFSVDGLTIFSGDLQSKSIPLPNIVFKQGFNQLIRTSLNLCQP